MSINSSLILLIRYRSNLWHNRHTRGFTLLELLVTLSIASTIAAISISSFSPLIQRQHTATNASQLVRALHFARTYAISSGKTVTVCPRSNSECGNDWSEGLQVFSDENKVLKPSKSRPVLQEAYFNTQLNEISLQASGRANHIRFSPQGMAMQFGNFKICPKASPTVTSDRTEGFEIKLIVNRQGRLRRKYSSNRVDFCS